MLYLTLLMPSICLRLHELHLPPLQNWAVWASSRKFVQNSDIFLHAAWAVRTAAALVQPNIERVRAAAGARLFLHLLRLRECVFPACLAVAVLPLIRRPRRPSGRCHCHRVHHAHPRRHEPPIKFNIGRFLRLFFVAAVITRHGSAFLEQLEGGRGPASAPDAGVGAHDVHIMLSLPTPARFDVPSPPTAAAAASLVPHAPAGVDAGRVEPRVLDVLRAVVAGSIPTLAGTASFP